MRKIVAIIILLSTILTVNAQKYREEIGVLVGTMDGLSYKCFGQKSRHFVFQFDVYWQWGFMPEGVRYDYTIYGNSHSYTEQTYLSDFPSAQYMAVMTSYSFMHQGLITSTDKGEWHWFVGGGFSLGACGGYDMDAISAEFRPNKSFRPWLKLGEHAIGGVEYQFSRIPLGIGMDVRPGMAENIQIKGIGVNRDEITAVAFDWGINLTVRYLFDNKRKGSE